MHVIKNAPIGYLENNTPQGVHWDYLEAIAKEANICIEKQLYPYPRIWESLAVGQHDGGIVFRSPTREHLVEFVAPIRRIQTVIIPHKSIKISHYKDLQNLTIGKTRGTKLNDAFDQDDSLNIVELNNYTQAALMLKTGRIDAIAGSSVVLSYQLQINQALDLVDLSNKFILGNREQWLQISKQSRQIKHIPAIRKAITKLKNNGELDRIMNKYYGPYWKQINN